jgi:hypothetical protein
VHHAAFVDHRDRKTLRARGGHRARGFGVDVLRSGNPGCGVAGCKRDQRAGGPCDALHHDLVLHGDAAG